jgi:c-di-GMP-binding flagellar brake protein YcgR
MSYGQDRRKYKRYENLPIEPPIMARFQIRSTEAQKRRYDDWYLATLMNISAGGTFFCYMNNLGIGSLLDLKIDVSTSTPTINCVGEIIRSDKLQHTSVFCIGIKFIDIGEKEKELISKTIEGI